MYTTIGSLYTLNKRMYTKSELPWTMEQLWLAFYMKEHNKVWDGNKWMNT